MNREIQDLGLARVQTTAWIRFMVEVEDENRNVIGVDRVEKAFNSRMTDIFQGSNLNEIIKEMFAHMKTRSKRKHWKIADLDSTRFCLWALISIS